MEQVHAQTVQDVKHAMPQQEHAYNVLKEKDLKMKHVLFAPLLNTVTESPLPVIHVIQLVKHVLEKQPIALVVNLILDFRIIPVLNVQVELLLMEHFHVNLVLIQTVQFVIVHV